MEILKNPINWFSTTSLSNQAVVVIVILALAYLMVCGFMKIKKPSVPKIGAGSIWKLFLSIISVAIIFLICYGFYLLYIYYRPTPEQLAYKESSKNLAELELEPEKAILKYFGKKIDKKELPTEKEKREVMAAEEKIRSVRKEYSEGKLAPPLQKIPAKPKEKTKLVWVARLLANRKQIEEAANMHLNQAANNKIEVDEINPFIRTETKIKFSYKKRGKLHEAVLTRDNPADEYYYGIVDLSDNTQLEMWLKEDGLEKYKGNARQIIKVGGKIIYAPLITASLEKEEIIISSK